MTGFASKGALLALTGSVLMAALTILASAVATPLSAQQAQPVPEVAEPAAPAQPASPPAAAQPATPPTPAVTQPAPAVTQPAPAAGAAPGWGVQVAPSGPSVNQAGVITGPLDDSQKALIAKVDAYFNAMTDLRGTFQQTDAEQVQDRGKFYISRPGKIRFEYGAPSKLVIMSNGKELSFEDYALNKADRYPLESTPFRILLADTVDVLRDAQVADLYEDQDLISLTLLDREPENKGQIKLLFAKAADTIQLREWVIANDGGDTRVEIGDLVLGEKPDAKLFQNADMQLEKSKIQK
jgi:outer membrane lipoprotein-sorting protein